ncbi:unnamed protein product, partial [Effrenium voratum]
VEKQEIDTPVGKVEALVSMPVGAKATATVLLIHGMSPKPEIVFEWQFLMEDFRRRTESQTKAFSLGGQKGFLLDGSGNGMHR